MRITSTRCRPHVHHAAVSTGVCPTRAASQAHGERACSRSSGWRSRCGSVIRTGARLLVATVLPLTQADGARAAASADELKRMYVSCNQAALESRLDADGVMACSVIYEQLKERVFDGSFDRLLAWS